MRTFLFLGLSALLATTSLAQQEASPDLFIPVTDGAPARSPRAEVGVARTRQVLLNLSPLEGADAPEGTVSRSAAQRVVVFNLFDDVSVEAVLEHAEPRPHGMIWAGRLLGKEWSNVTLVVDRGEITGSVAWPLAAYSIRPLGAGRHAVNEVDRAAFPDDEPGAVPSTPAAASTEPGAAAAADDGNTIDLLVAYTPAARANAGGTTAIQNLIALGVSETNQAYANSGVVQRLRLVHTAEVAYSESSDISVDLDRVTGTSDGFMDTVHALRNTHGADMVKLVIDTGATTGGCGVAWLMSGVSASFASNAFSVTERVCISPNYTFGHELGHNMGLNHARSDPTGTGAFGYSYGYKDPSNTFRTVMAYNCLGSGCPRVLNISNPGITYGGLPTGVVTSSAESAHNAQTLNNTRTTVANWRQSTGNTPGPATLVSPAGTVTTPTPTYTWNAVTSATDYQLFVAGPAGTLVQTWYSATAVCSGSTCSVVPTTALAFGAHSWQILTSNSFGTGQWSAVGAFSVNASTLTVSAASVPAGQPAQVTVDEGPGLVRDWIGLYLTGATDSGYVDWKYLNGTRTPPSAGSPSAIVTFPMPATPGTYNFRFFQNNTFTKLATSATVTVTAATAPILEVTPTSLAFGSLPTGGTSDKTLTVRNAGAGTLTGNAVVSGSGYRLVGTDSYSLGPNQSATLTVRFAPTAGGTATGTVTLTGGAGASVALSGSGVAPAPTVTVSATSVNPGDSVQVTVANGPGYAKDWVGLHGATGPDTVNLDWKYLNGTRTSPATPLTGAAIAFTMPTTPGTYNFRFFQNNTYTRLAASATVTVLTLPPAITVSSTSVEAGQTVQVTVQNGPGYPKDWAGLYGAAAADTAILDWKFLNGTRIAPVTGLTSATLTFSAPTVAGTYNFRLFQNNTYTRLATSATVTVTPPTTPVLQATPTSLAFGSLATGAFADRTVTIRNVGAGTLTGNASVSGPGFSLVGATSYSLAADQTAVLTVRFSPAAGGSASGSLALTGGGGATVPLTGSGTALPSLAVNTTVAAPGATVQVTVSNGTGNPRDWVGLHAIAAADTTWLDWKYLSGTRTLPPTGLASATIAFTMPTTPGTYNFRLFQDGGFTKLATSPTVTVQVASPNVVVLGATTVSPGTTVQVSIQNGPANAKDWVALHGTAAADTVYLDWKYLNGTRTAPSTGQASATLSFTAPTTPGTYNFRFFQNNTYTRLATSDTLTVQ